MSGSPNRNGGRRAMVHAPVDTLDLTALREEAERKVEYQAPAPEPNPEWHDIAQSMYTAALESGQRALWEPSDVWVMYLLAEDLSRCLEPQYVGMRFTGNGSEQEPIFESMPVPGGKIAAYRGMFNDLLLTAEARRKAGVAVERKAAPRDENAELVEQARVDRLQLVQGGSA